MTNKADLLLAALQFKVLDATAVGYDDVLSLAANGMINQIFLMCARRPGRLMTRDGAQSSGQRVEQVPMGLLAYRDGRAGERGGAERRA